MRKKKFRPPAPKPRRPRRRWRSSLSIPCPPTRMEVSGRPAWWNDVPDQMEQMVLPDQRSRNSSGCRLRWTRCRVDSRAGSSVLRSRWCCRPRRTPLEKVRSKQCRRWNKIQIKTFKPSFNLILIFNLMPL